MCGGCGTGLGVGATGAAIGADTPGADTPGAMISNSSLFTINGSSASKTQIEAKKHRISPGRRVRAFHSNSKRWV